MHIDSKTFDRKRTSEMKDFIFVEPTTVHEALDFLEQKGEESKILAGGCSLTILLKNGLIDPKYVVSIEKLPGLDSLKHENSQLRIGSLVPHRVIELSGLIKTHQPMLSQMASCIGQVQVRNLGTLGGNLCHAEHRADPPAALLALGAKVVLASKTGDRTLTMDNFVEDYYQTVIKPGEILVEVLVSDLPPNSFSKYLRFSPRSTMEEPIVTVAVVSVPNKDGKIKELRLALGAVAPKPFRVYDAEKLLVSKGLSEEAISEAASIAADHSDPLEDIYGPADWKREMVSVHVRRILKTVQEHHSHK